MGRLIESLSAQSGNYRCLCIGSIVLFVGSDYYLLVWSIFGLSIGSNVCCFEYIYECLFICIIGHLLLMRLKPAKRVYHAHNLLGILRLVLITFWANYSVRIILSVAAFIENMEFKVLMRRGGSLHIKPC